MLKEDLKILKDELENWHSYNDNQLVNKDSALKVIKLAESIFFSEEATSLLNKDFIKCYLDTTRRTYFLRSLPERDKRYRWAEIAFKAIDIADYNLRAMFSQRVLEHPNRALFKVADGSGGNKLTDFSYKWVDKRTRQIASVLYKLMSNSAQEPRVAIFSDNSLESACSDIACLLYDIFDSPLNVHFSSEILSDIFKQININVVITDSEHRLQQVLRAREKYEGQLKIIYLGYDVPQSIDHQVFIMERLLSQITPEETENILNKRECNKSLHEMATVLFTSGSTGNAKGVAFSMYNLITKRFARAAALPEVGEKEVLLCYLPLFHTFGRFLEMMGMIFWGGTYVFSGNPSIETLLALMQKVNPTGIISIPLRLVQIRDRFLQVTSKNIDKKSFQKLTGSSLRWGLSAAGYLDPKVFSFFHNHNVELCSGFGMTEATGGITMTPPGGYVKNSVGIPLPGIKTRLNSKGELELSGVYVARYMEDNNFGKEGEFWLPTGDLFKIDKHGHYHIIDRIKDIYKNVKGQTIAPRSVERLFDDIPGFKRAFLAGDGLAYNTLLIVPDKNDPILQKAASKKKMTDYFGPIIVSANKNLPSYERIVDFTILERDFDEQKGELTSKGTMRRKNIETNFSLEIQRMYKFPNLDLKIDELKIIIPRWVIRDLGITEYDIKVQSDGIFNKLNQRFLTVKFNYKNDRIRIGDFEYIVSSKQVDLGVFIRQPALWIGNISLINFAFCKDGWDTSYEGISPQVFLAQDFYKTSKGKVPELLHRIQDAKLRELNQTITTAIFAKGSKALEAVQSIERSLHMENHRTVYLLRRRLEALALHPDFEVRSYAYRILLFDEPRLDYSKYLPPFINSGLPFINRKSIEEITKADFELGRLESLRQRLEAYRNTITWTSNSVTINQFKRILELLVRFAKHNRNYYSSVREELISWILHKKEPQLSAYAQELFNKLAAWFESTFELSKFESEITNWKRRIVFQEDFSSEEVRRIESVICCSTFLKEALLLIFEEDKFSLSDVHEGGIWISRILSPHNAYLYRISINTVFNKHFDLMLLIKDDITKAQVRETIYWMIKISGYPGSSAVLPKFGNFRSSLGAASLVYINELTVWDKIRDYSSARGVTAGSSAKIEYKWKVLFVRAIAVFLKAWQNSGRSVIPGAIAPTNVVVPEADVKQNSRILSLSGWRTYRNTLDLIHPAVKNFFLQTLGNYPWDKESVKIEWIFDAVMESFEKNEAIEFLRQLRDDLMEYSVHYTDFDLLGELNQYINRVKAKPYINLPLLSAIERYNEWLEANPASTHEAKEQFIKKLYWLYQIERYPEIMRYIFYEHTYFANAKEEVREKLSKLISVMFDSPDEHATKLIELSEFQDVLTDPKDRLIFSRLVFPEVAKPLNIELMTIGEDENKDVILKTRITDRKDTTHIIRKAISPFEVGSLNRLFILDDYPVSITAEDHFLILTDEETQESVNGGICYKILDSNVAHLEGIVVAQPFRGRGLGGNMLEDFCARMFAEGIKVITTHFYLTSFFTKYQFKVDSRWGGLVRFLS
ncbi:MAG: GNAT family N-acetyltransferase [Bacteroidota bacterium]|nr:GNAT family N-acetyltransferase [Bacteroidota bacterium]